MNERKEKMSNIDVSKFDHLSNAEPNKVMFDFMGLECFNMLSPSSGRAVANQFIIKSGKVKAFKSYDSLIIVIDENGKVYLDEYYWNWSQTTGKYRNQFLNEKRRDTEKKIKSGEYKLVNLNRHKNYNY